MDKIGPDLLKAIERAREAWRQHVEREHGGDFARWDREIEAEKRRRELGSEAGGPSVAELARACRVPERHLQLFAAGPPRSSDAVRAADRATRGGNLVMYGATNTGKSTAASWLVWLRCIEAERNRCGPPALVLRACDLCAELLHKDEHRRTTTLSALSDRRLLVLDDLGWDYGGQSDFAFSRLSEVLDHRERAQLQTVATTNLHPDALRERLGRHEDERARNWRRLVGDTKPVLLRRAWDAR